MKRFFQKIPDFYNLVKQSTKEAVTDFFKPVYVKVTVMGLVLFSGANFYIAYLLIKNLPQRAAILHYNVVFGIDELASPQLIYWRPALAAAFAIVNLILAAASFRHSRFLPKLFLGFAVYCQLWALLALYSIYLVNSVNIKL